MSVTPRIAGLDDGRIATENLVPGVAVYEEPLLNIRGREFRTWDPSRSKLGAYLLKGGREWPIGERTRVLYLGAANGTTVSHVSDITVDGTVVAVEFSPRSFRDLLSMSTPRENIAPVLADAWQPSMYARFAPDIDVVVQDIAQRQQGLIFAKNLLEFLPKHGLLAVKARSVDVAANPRAVYEDVRVVVETETAGAYKCIETVPLDPFEKDHAVLTFLRTDKPVPTGATKAQPQEARPRPAPQPRDPRQGPGFAQAGSGKPRDSGQGRPAHGGGGKSKGKGTKRW